MPPAGGSPPPSGGRSAVRGAGPGTARTSTTARLTAYPAASPRRAYAVPERCGIPVRPLLIPRPRGRHADRPPRTVPDALSPGLRASTRAGTAPGRRGTHPPRPVVLPAGRGKGPSQRGGRRARRSPTHSADQCSGPSASQVRPPPAGLGDRPGPPVRAPPKKTLRPGPLPRFGLRVRSDQLRAPNPGPVPKTRPRGSRTSAGGPASGGTLSSRVSGPMAGRPPRSAAPPWPAPPNHRRRSQEPRTTVRGDALRARALPGQSGRGGRARCWTSERPPIPERLFTPV